MSDDLVYWKNALMGILGPIHENDPQCGWYRTRPKRGYASFPVRIWRGHEGAPLRALKAGKDVDPYDVWTWCCMNPVSEDAYNAALESGAPWPDDVPSSYKASKAFPSHASAIRLRQRSEQIGNGEGHSLSPQSKPLMPKGHAPHIEIPNAQVVFGMPKGRDLQERPESQNDNLEDRQEASRKDLQQPILNQSSLYPSMGHNSAKMIDAGHQFIHHDQDGSHDEAKDLSSHKQNAKPSQSRLEIMLDPFSDAREMSDHITLLWDDVSSWLENNGPIVGQVQADRCANYASALSNLEALSEDMRVREKKPFLDECRSVDAKWKPIIEAAKSARQSCKKAIEPFLVSEWFRIETISRKEKRPFYPPSAGSLGRAISLRHREKVVITGIEDVSCYYCCDERLLKNETFRKILRQYAEDDLKNGKVIPGTKRIEERSVS